MIGLTRPLLSMALLWALCASASAETLRVLTTGAFKPVVQAVAQDFAQSTPHQIQIVNDTAGGLTRRIQQGEVFDVVILTPAGLQTLDQQGLLLPGTSTPLARVGVGLAVKTGQPHPPLATQEDFVRALQSARKVAYIDPASGGSSGIYLEGLFRQLPLHQDMARKAVLVNGGLVAEKLLTGEADLAIHQISEILAVQGVDLVGPLPAAIQNYTRYAGAVGKASAHAAIGRQFLSAFASPLALETLRSKGLER